MTTNNELTPTYIQWEMYSLMCWVFMSGNISFIYTVPGTNPRFY